MSRLVAVTALATSIFMLNCSAVAQSQTRGQRQVLLQREWQQLIQQMEQQNAKLGEQEAAFGEEGLKQTEDVIKELVQIIKGSAPGEDVPDLKDWLDFAEKLGELEHWYGKKLDDLGDSATNSGTIEARLGTLNQRLREYEVMIKAKVGDLRAIDHAMRNQKIQLHPLPLPQPDWTQLDQAIENMRKEDQPFLQSLPVSSASLSRAELVAQENAAAQASVACHNQALSCMQSCQTYECVPACDQCAAADAAFSATSKSLEDFDMQQSQKH